MLTRRSSVHYTCGGAHSEEQDKTRTAFRKGNNEYDLQPQKH